MSTLAVITARGGSKGLPGKNIMPVQGKPLIGYTIDAARAAKVVDRVILSSDDDDIMNVARSLQCDVPFKRPAALATDTATSMDVVMHALDSCPGFDHVVLLQPTSPLRTAADIDAAFAVMQATSAPACVSVAPVEQSPYWMYNLDGERLVPVVPSTFGAVRRQDLPAVYTLNGAIYIANIQWLRQSRTFVTPETVAYRMPLERSVDIDTAADVRDLMELLGRGV